MNDLPLLINRSVQVLLSLTSTSNFNWQTAVLPCWNIHTVLSEQTQTPNETTRNYPNGDSYNSYANNQDSALVLSPKDVYNLHQQGFSRYVVVLVKWKMDDDVVCDWRQTNQSSFAITNHWRDLGSQIQARRNAVCRVPWRWSRGQIGRSLILYACKLLLYKYCAIFRPSSNNIPCD